MLAFTDPNDIFYVFIVFSVVFTTIAVVWGTLFVGSILWEWLWGKMSKIARYHRLRSRKYAVNWCKNNNLSDVQTAVLLEIRRMLAWRFSIYFYIQREYGSSQIICFRDAFFTVKYPSCSTKSLAFYIHQDHCSVDFRQDDMKYFYYSDPNVFSLLLKEINRYQKRKRVRV